MKHSRRYTVFYKCFAAAVITEALLLFGFYKLKDSKMHVQACVYISLLGYNIVAARLVHTHYRIKKRRERFREISRANNEFLHSRYPHLKPEPQNHLEIN